jgi:rRNA methylases
VIIEVTDPEDPRVHEYTHLTDVALRRVLEPAAGLYLAESSTVIRRAVAAGHSPRSLLLAPRWLESVADILVTVGGAPDGGAVPVYLAPEELLRTITGFHLHRGALAAMHRPALGTVGEVLARARGGAGARRVVVLEDIVDHTNVGAVVRSAAALGVDAVLVTPRCADPLYRRAVRVSMGTDLPGSLDAHRPVAGRDRPAALPRLHRGRARARSGHGPAGRARRAAPERLGPRPRGPRATGWHPGRSPAPTSPSASRWRVAWTR